MVLDNISKSSIEALSQVNANGTIEEIAIKAIFADGFVTGINSFNDFIENMELNNED
jgi:hypothetical protein